MGLRNEQPPFNLSLITGATSGIGLALAELLADKGIPLLIHGRDAQKLQALAKTLSDKVAVTTLQADLSTSEGQQHMVSAIQQYAPELLINNAGIGLYGPVLSHSTEEQMKILELDGAALVRFSIEGARALHAKGKKGVILNVSSVVAFFTAPRMALYAASKALVNQFSESFDAEMRPLGIRILAAAPGVVTSNFRARAGGASFNAWDSRFAMTTRQAAEEIWSQIARRKAVHIFNWPYRCMAFLARYILPKTLIAKLFNQNILALQKPYGQNLGTPK